MSEHFIACKALAAMIREHGKPDVDEIVYVAHAALELGLDPAQNSEIQQILKNGGDFDELIAGVESDETRLFLFRRIVSATLLDEQINESEKRYISKTAEVFGYDPDVVEEYISWLCEGMDWERRGLTVMGRLKG